VEILGYSQEYSGANTRNISTGIPEWMKPYYLDVPETMRPKLLELVITIVSEEGTNLVKAVQINNYLRNNLSYRDEVDIPDGVDPIEWFLFEGKEGYCNYFASAEVLLLRSVGIPSRIAVGYSQGQKIDNRQYQVRVRDSHAWVEVYFPDVGWVIFEPTPAYPAQDYLKIENENVEADNKEIQSPSEFQFGRESNIPVDVLLNQDLTNSIEKRRGLPIVLSLTWLIPLLVLLVLVYLFVIRENRNIIVPVITRVYQKIGTPLPRRLEEWFAYENLSPLAKRMKKIRKLSTLLIDDRDEFTSMELFQKLDQIMDGKRDYLTYFLNVYQQEVFGNKKADYDSGLNHSYKEIVFSIIATFFKKQRSKWVCMLNLRW
jgi:hypothetical protein